MFDRIKNLKNFIGNTFGSARASEEFTLRETDFGTVHVDTSIVRRIIERIKLEGVNEIKNVNVYVPTVNLPLQIKLSLIILPSYSAPIIGAKLREAIKEELKNMLDINDALFDIRVTQVNQNNLSDKKKRRVR